MSIAGAGAAAGRHARLAAPSRIARRTVIAVLLVCIASGAFAAPRPAIQHSLAVEGATLALWEKSSGARKASLLLVHGRTWSALPNFDLQVAGERRSVMDALAKEGFAVYALDLRGYGASARDATGWLTPERAAEDVHAALDWINRANPRLARRAALVGYSRGSQVALLTAQRHPEAMSALVLFGFPTTVRASPTPTPPEPPRAPNTAENAASDFITPGAASPALIAAYVAQALAANPVRVDWRDEQQFVFAPEKITVPTLVLYGARDPLLRAESASFFAALATPDRAFVVLPDSDHAAHVENSQRAWIHALAEFLRQPRG